MRARIILCGLIMFGLLGSGNLLAQNEDPLKPLSVPRIFFSVSTVNDWVDGFINQLERKGWRIYDPIVNGWGYLVDKEIAFIEMESVKGQDDLYTPRVDQHVNGFNSVVGGPNQAGSMYLFQLNPVPIKRFYRRDVSGIEIPLILIKIEDLPHHARAIDKKVTEYRYIEHFYGKNKRSDQKKSMLSYLRLREKEGWRSFFDLDLPAEKLLGKQVAYIEGVSALLNSSLNFTEGFVVSGIDLDKSDEKLIGISGGGSVIYLEDLVRDEADRPILLVSPHDVEGLQAEKELVKHFASPRRGTPPGVRFALVTDFSEGLDLGLDPWSEELANRLRRLRGLGLSQIHILVDGDISRHREWLEEIKDSIFYGEMNQDPEFIQLHPKKRDQEGWFQESLIKWGREAKARDATDLILVEKDPELIEAWLAAIGDGVGLGGLINGILIIEGGGSLGQNVARLPRGHNLTLKGRSRFGFELMIDHLVKPEKLIILSGANKLSFYPPGLESKEVVLGGPTPAWQGMTRFSVGEILDKKLQTKLSQPERADVVHIISDALTISRQEKGDVKLAFIQQLEDLSPQLPAELRQRVLNLSQYLFVADDFFPVPAFEGQLSISRNTAALYLERMGQREFGVENAAMTSREAREIRQMLKIRRKSK